MSTQAAQTVRVMKRGQPLVTACGMYSVKHRDSDHPHGDERGRHRMQLVAHVRPDLCKHQPHPL